MKLIKLPKDLNYAEAYLTLKCNLSCSYCINDPDDKTVRNRKELSGKEWADSLNRFDFGDVPITFGGGEPTIHPDFYEILDNLAPRFNVDLLTNGQFNVGEFISRTSPNRFTKKNPAYKSIRISYHPEQVKPEELVKKAVNLQTSGFKVGIFGVNHPKNIEANVEMAELTRKNQVYFFIKDFLGEFGNQFFGSYQYPDAVKGKQNIPVLCKINELLISPEGNVYKCHRDLYHDENPIGNIQTKVENKYRPCGNYGNCNPCDVKMKMDRNLKRGNCPVDILK